MEIGRWIKKLLVLLTIIFIAFFPVITPTVYAVSSWSGDTWEGNTWEGDTWEGDTWEGNSWDGSDLEWNGSTWDGKGTDGSVTEGSDWLGYEWTSIPWYIEGWSEDGFNGDGTTGNPWSEEGYNGGGTTGNPWSEGGFNGDGTKGESWSEDGFNSDGTKADSWSGEGTDGNGTSGDQPFYDTGAYKVTHYLTNDVLNSSANFINNGLDKKSGLDGAPFRPGKFTSNFLLNSTKLVLGNNDIVNAADAGFKAYDSYDSVKAIQGMAKNFGDIQNNSSGRDVLSNTSKIDKYKVLFKDSSSKLLKNTDISAIKGTWKSMGALSKFNAGLSAVNTFVSAYKTGDSIADFASLNDSASGTDKVSAGADIGANIGETLMSAGGVALAIPGGQAIGAGIMAAGAGLYAVSKGVKLVAKNWDKVTKAADAVKDTAKKAWDTVTGWF
ncbi:hypothetical protein [Virgibacillus salinus]|uniref:Uncharacterized protein n=1 Tax=Virgibacillus salinus TaxID=553311 RepID=A0A1H0ZMS1_9BACI|nr:hypothetical protein [Virgibacillus salinus]SDQ28481.1 hypothetical protein SAMN05216231_1318 [Virgibacillus salinus]